MRFPDGVSGRLMKADVRFRCRLASGVEVLIKASASDNPAERRRGRMMLDRERTCLEVLRGLAVPEEVRMPRAALRRLVPVAFQTAIALHYEPGKPLALAGFSIEEAVGAWAHITEQIVAFRRHQILYVDVKPHNIIASRDPLRVLVIDFSLAVAQVGRVRIPNFLAYSLGFQAPEQWGGGVHDERSLVFQLGMLLANTTAGMASWNMNRVIKTLRTRLERAKAGCVFELLSSCLAIEPAWRPRTYEQVLDRIRELKLPAESQRTWETLRRPYEARLAEVGL